MQKEKSKSPKLEELRKQIHEVNQRLTNVESLLEKIQSSGFGKENTSTIQTDEDFEINLPLFQKRSLELGAGEYGMAWLGNIVLFFGIIFLAGYLQNTGSNILSTLIGFIAVAGIYAASLATRKSYSYLSKLFAYNGHFLLYYFTLHLHFFQDNPIVKNESLGLMLLISVTAVLFIQAYQKKSQLMAGIVLVLLLYSGIISNSTNVLAVIATVTAVIVLVLYYRFGWSKLVFIFIFLIYTVHLDWLINNPFIGNNPEFIASPGSGYICFISTGFIFSMIALIPKQEKVSNEFIITALIWNGLGFTFILALLVFTYFKDNYVHIFVAISLFCIIYSVILQLRSLVKISASIYVLYGFLALSVAIFGMYGLPESYSLFALQSLLVVSLALWYRSRFIVIMNTVLFLAFMIAYLNGPISDDLTNLSFMLAAFVSARVINWQEERLHIKTELVRNLYLISGFVMTLITFYHFSPPSYITASWIFAAMLFFAISLLIKKKKYRWLAIAALVASAVRLIYVDMSSINIGYRVLIFMALAIISITISILYTTYLTKKKE